MAGRRRSLKETKRMTARRKKQTRLLIMAGAGLILVALLAVYIQLRNYVNRVDRDVICDNVWIGAMDVSGMTAEEAGAALEGHMEADGAVTVTLQSDSGSAQATLSELGLTAEDVDKLTREAVDYGKTGILSLQTAEGPGKRKTCHPGEIQPGSGEDRGCPG